MIVFGAGARAALGTGIGSASIPVLLVISGFGLVTASYFPTDPILGYPPGGARSFIPSAHGEVHHLASLAVFVCLPIVCFSAARRFRHVHRSRSWSLLSYATALLLVASMAAFMVCMAMAANAPLDPPGPAGLFERSFSVVASLWLSLFALKLMRLGEASASWRLASTRRDMT